MEESYLTMLGGNSLIKLRQEQTHITSTESPMGTLFDANIFGRQTDHSVVTSEQTIQEIGQYGPTPWTRLRLTGRRLNTTAGIIYEGLSPYSIEDPYVQRVKR